MIEIREITGLKVNLFIKLKLEIANKEDQYEMSVIGEFENSNVAWKAALIFTSTVILT